MTWTQNYTPLFDSLVASTLVAAAPVVVLLGLLAFFHVRAHLAALVGTDPTYFARAGVPLNAVDGIILLDGAGYDIAQQMARPVNPVGFMYDAAFGRDPKRQRALSPTLHAALPNVANWLILPVASRSDSTAQSNDLATGLRANGATARVVPVPGENHGSLNRGLGEAGDFATGEIDRFLTAIR